MSEYDSFEESFALPMQYRPEWFAYMDFIRAYFGHRKIERPLVVEIGIWANAQRPFYEHYLGARHIGIDIQNKAGTPDILGDSHAPETLARLKSMIGVQAIDLLFIDGAHDYQSVRRDYEIYTPLVRGIVALHDIAGLAGPRQLWGELIGTVPGEKVFISIDSRSKPRTGIGIIADP